MGRIKTGNPTNHLPRKSGYMMDVGHTRIHLHDLIYKPVTQQGK